MMRALLVMLIVAGPIAAQDARPKFPQPGSKVPIHWPVINLSGERAGHFHCLISRHNLRPVVMIVAREPAPEALWTTLIPRLEELSEQFKDETALRAFAVLLSPHARTSATQADPDEPLDVNKTSVRVVEETNERLKLFAKVKEKIVPEWKQTVVAAFPMEVPKELNLDAMAEMTVVFYERYDVIASWKFEAGKFDEAAAQEIAERVKMHLGRKKPK